MGCKRRRQALKSDSHDPAGHEIVLAVADVYVGFFLWKIELFALCVEHHGKAIQLAGNENVIFVVVFKMQFREVVAEYPVTFWSYISWKGQVMRGPGEPQIIGERKTGTALIWG